MEHDKCDICELWKMEEDYYTFEEAFSPNYPSINLDINNTLEGALESAQLGDDHYLKVGDIIRFNSPDGVQVWVKQSMGYTLREECYCDE